LVPYFLFFGFVTWVNGTLIPYLKIACQLKTDFESYLVATAFFIAYTAMAIHLLMSSEKRAIKKVMVIGLLVMALGAILFIPAASTRKLQPVSNCPFCHWLRYGAIANCGNPLRFLLSGPIESAATRIA